MLQYHLAPFLANVEDLNEVLPKTHKIIRKFPQGHVDSHHFNILKNKLKVLIQRCDDLIGERRYLAIYRVVQELGRPYTLPIFAHGNFKTAVIDKLFEFQEYEKFGLHYPPVSEKWFKMLKRQCNKTIKVILEA